MEAYVAEHWEPDSAVLDEYWEKLHDPANADSVLALIDSIKNEVGNIENIPIAAGLFARAYAAGEWPLMEQLYINALPHRAVQYRLLARVRDEGNWPMYEDLLRLLKPQVDDLQWASLSDVTGLRIYLENVTPTQEVLSATVRTILEEGIGDETDVAKLRVLLPLLRDKQSLAGDLTALLQQPAQWPLAIALITHGVQAVPRLIEALTWPGAYWPLLRSKAVWPDLPYRIVVGLQREDALYRATLGAVLGRNLTRYIQAAL